MANQSANQRWLDSSDVSGHPRVLGLPALLASQYYPHNLSAMMPVMMTIDMHIAPTRQATTMCTK
jgi:hypothetical protein